tara:strand:- start:22 stop:456 length:435 start_codon:yes stop_codon:yes gene_type:complete
MLKYLLFIVIGIILCILYNSNDTFSIGAPGYTIDDHTDWTTINRIKETRIRIINLNIEHLNTMIDVLNDQDLERNDLVIRRTELNNRLREITEIIIPPLPQYNTNEAVMNDFHTALTNAFNTLLEDYVQHYEMYCATNLRSLRV